MIGVFFLVRDRKRSCDKDCRYENTASPPFPLNSQPLRKLEKKEKVLYALLPRTPHLLPSTPLLTTRTHPPPTRQIASLSWEPPAFLVCTMGPSQPPALQGLQCFKQKDPQKAPGPRSPAPRNTRPAMAGPTRLQTSKAGRTAGTPMPALPPQRARSNDRWPGIAVPCVLEARIPQSHVPLLLMMLKRPPDSSPLQSTGPQGSEVGPRDC